MFTLRTWLSDSTTPQSPDQRTRLGVTLLEEREVPVANLFVDFGNAIPSGGLLTTVGQLRNTFSNGGLQGPDLNGTMINTSKGVIYLNDNSPLEVVPFNTAVATFDYNGDGLINSVDMAALQSDIVTQARSYYSPFDVNVTAVANSSAVGIQSQMQANNTLPAKKNDAYALVAGYYYVASDGSGYSIGAASQSLGKAPIIDLAAGANLRDDTVAMFAERFNAVFANSSMMTGSAFEVAHEAGHAFGLRHSSRGTSDHQLLTASDVMASDGGSPPPTQPARRDNFFTNYPLPAETGGGVTNAYAQLAADPDIGTGVAIPLLPRPAFVTGTGGNDDITITRGVGSTASVVVRAYRDAAHTQLLGEHSYTLTDVTFGIDVRTGTGNDKVSLVGRLPGGVTIDGGTDTDSVEIRSPGTLVGHTNNPDGTPNQRVVASPTGTTAVTHQNVETTRLLPAASVSSVTLNGKVYNFVIGADFSLKSNESSGPGWTAFTTRDAAGVYGTGASITATAVQGANGYINVFVVDDNGNIRRVWFNASTSTWGSEAVTSGNAFSSGVTLSAFENPSATATNLFAVNTSGKVVQVRGVRPTNTAPYVWSGPFDVTAAGQFASGTPLAYYESPSTGVINLFAVNTAGNITQVRYGPQIPGGPYEWSGPHLVTTGGAFLAGTPLSYYENAAGVINLFAVNATGDIVQVRYGPQTPGGSYQWSGPNLVTSSSAFVPGTSLAYYENPSTGVINLFAVNTTGNVVQVRYSGSWSVAEITGLGVTFVPGTPLTYTGDDSTPFLYGLGADGFVRRVTIAGGSWGATHLDPGTSLIVF